MNWMRIEYAPLDGTYCDLWVKGPDGEQRRVADCSYVAGEWGNSQGPILWTITHFAKIEPPEAPHNGQPAPANSLPGWGECQMRVANSEYVEKEGKLRDPHGLYANPLHEFIYEYDDNDGYRSAWFMHRLELALNFVKQEAIDSVSAPPQAPLDWPTESGWWWIISTGPISCSNVSMVTDECACFGSFLHRKTDTMNVGWKFLPAPMPNFGGDS